MDANMPVEHSHLEPPRKVHPKGKLAAVTRKRNDIEKLFNDPNVDGEVLKQQYKEFLTKIEDLYEACTDEYSEWLSVHKEDIEAFRKYIEGKLYPTTMANFTAYRNTKSIISSKSSKSVKSDKSSCVSERIRIAQLKAKALAEEAARVTELELQEREISLRASYEQQQLKLQDSKKILQHETRMREIETMAEELRIIENEDTLSSKSSKSSVKQFLQNNPVDGAINKKTPNISKPIFHSTPAEQTDVFSKISQVLATQNEISLAMVKHQIQSSLPNKELPPFDGLDITKYKPFILNFKRIIADSCDLFSDKFIYLRQYTTGKARKIVDSCQHYDASRAYNTAVQLLDEEFGSEFKITCAYINRLHNWPSIKSEDVTQMEELSVFLSDCHHYFENMKSTNQLQSPNEMMKIIQKLPYGYRARWRRETHNLIEKYGAVYFEDLVNFIKTETKILKQPFFSNINDDAPKKPYTQRDPSKKTMTTIAKDKNSKYCSYCKKNNHFLDTCKFFVKITLAERIEFIKKNYICFACLESNHYSKNCTNRKKCEKCPKSHPTILHDSSKDVSPEKKDSPPNPEETVSMYSSLNNKNKPSKIQFPTIPVIVSTQNSDKLVTINCVLDTCSSDCWISENLLSKLGVKCQETTLNVSTLEGMRNKTSTKVLHNLLVTDLNNNTKIVIPTVFTKPVHKWPFNSDDLLDYSDINQYTHLNDIPLNLSTDEIELLIGINVPEIHYQLETIQGKPEEPFAAKHNIGWAVYGPINKKNKRKRESKCNFIKTDYEITNYVKQIFCEDFVDKDDGTLLSFNDGKWLESAKKSIVKKNNNYTIDLPLRENSKFPDNKQQILRQFTELIKRLKNNDKDFDEYKAFMDMMISKGYVEEIPPDEINSTEQKWYLPHHSVRHKVKGKLRVVFNGSSKHHGISLNDNLLQGPDFTNNLYGVLLRFREGNIALSADIVKMFYQVKVPQKHANLLRFFWISDEDTECIKEYRLLVHVFGAISSPSIANFALQQTSVDTQNPSESAKAAILKSFYVDDLLVACDSEKEAEKLTQDIVNILAEGGFELSGFVSNAQDVTNKFQISHKEDYELQKHENMVLGVIWNTLTDTFGFRVNININLQPTKRNILRTLASIYDPLGLVNPAILEAKRIFQFSNNLKIDWDDTLNNDLCERWKKWVTEIMHLESYHISRCIKPVSHPERVELHTFVDGSESAYGAVSYLKILCDNNHYVFLLSSKSRLTPTNNKTLKTTPRIELCSAKLGIELSIKIRKEINLQISQVFYWSDSMTVLRYLKNEDKKFKRFVANKISYILSNSHSENWHYIATKENPADLVSRGLPALKLKESILWNQGPNILNHDTICFDQNYSPELEDFSELNNTAAITKREKSPIDELMQSTSSWLKLKRRIASMIILKNALKNKEKLVSKKFEILHMNLAEKIIILYIQKEFYPEVFKCVSNNEPLPKSSNLRKFTPLIHDDCIRAGGRLENSNSSFNIKHPIILPGKSRIVALLVKHVHTIFGHMGRDVVLAYLRKKFLIVGANALVRRVIYECMTCKRMKAKPSVEFMADLPAERLLTDIPAFTNVGIDCFGPFWVTIGRKQDKRYGVVFSCMSSRAIHLEMCYTLSTDSFICALRRFIARRGNLKCIVSDNATNFVCGRKELAEGIKEWNGLVIENWLLQNNIQWKFNPPTGSHFGGFYEREIRSIRNVLTALLNEQKIKLTDEYLSTLMCEVEAILNNRPLTEVSSDPKDSEVLTPNHLLLLNAGVTLPPGLFDRKDEYCRRRWRQVQYLVDLFWKRWREEYMILLHKRQKWNKIVRSHKVNDLVLVVDNLLPRNEWCVGRITEIFPDNNNKVRKAKVKIVKSRNASSEGFDTKELLRPISKLILLSSA